MANTNLTVEQVKSTIKAIDESPSRTDTSSQVYGTRTTRGGGGSKKPKKGGRY